MGSLLQEAQNVVSDQEIIELQRRLVSIPSYTTEETDLAEFIADYLTDNKVFAGLQRVPFGRHTRSASGKSYNVIARIPGTASGPSLLCNGHMDHGPLDGRHADNLSAWQRRPFDPVVEDGYLYGKGAQDEKGGVCAMLIAAVAVRRLNARLRGDFIVTPVCGHKSYSTGTRHLLRSGLRADFAINVENSGNAISPLHCGVVTATVQLDGGHPHPTQRRRYPALAQEPPPFDRVVRFLEAIGPESTAYSPDGWLRFTPHPVLRDFPWHHVDKVESLGFRGKVIHLWYHTPPGVTEEGLKKDLEDVITGLRREDPGFQAHVETRAFGPALDTPADAPIVRMLAKWHREISGDVPSVGAEARYGLYGDSSLLAQAGISSVVYGPGGGLSDLAYEKEVLEGLRPPDERIRVRDLILAARVLTRAAIGVCSAETPDELLHE